MPPLMGQNSTISRILREKIPKIENFRAEVRKKENPEVKGSRGWRGHRKRVPQRHGGHRGVTESQRKFLGMQEAKAKSEIQSVKALLGFSLYFCPYPKYFYFPLWPSVSSVPLWFSFSASSCPSCPLDLLSLPRFCSLMNHEPNRNALPWLKEKEIFPIPANG